MARAQRANRILAVLGVLAGVTVVSSSIVYWSISRRFAPGDREALKGIVSKPLQEHLVFQNVNRWNGIDDGVLEHQSVVVRDGRFQEISDATTPVPAGARVIDGTGLTLSSPDTPR
jgi:hypothetical protein